MLKIVFVSACLIGLSLPTLGHSIIKNNPILNLVDEPVAKKSRLIVSFISIGQGINHDSQTEFLNFVANYKNKPSYTTVLWGREGEVDYCFDLNELSKKETKKFIKHTRKMALTNKLITVEENVVCPHKGR